MYILQRMSGKVFNIVCLRGELAFSFWHNWMTFLLCYMPFASAPAVTQFKKKLTTATLMVVVRQRRARSEEDVVSHITGSLECKLARGVGDTASL